MFKNILIVSDNLSMCKRILPITENYKDRSFSYATSPFSDGGAFAVELKKEIFTVNMKNEVTVEKLIATYDLIISMHCKQIFPEKLASAVKCINVHPGYNPVNRGWYPQVFAILNDLPIGATIHEIDEKLDHGKIIARAFVSKSISDTSLSLYNKIMDKEIELFSANIDHILNDSYSAFYPENEGNLFLKKDFHRLCAINLQESKTVGETINMLRALSHGDFKNAFFVDEDTGKKIYINVNLSEEC